jgi:hypothetical protein
MKTLIPAEYKDAERTRVLEKIRAFADSFGVSERPLRQQPPTLDELGAEYAKSAPAPLSPAALAAVGVLARD